MVTQLIWYLISISLFWISVSKTPKLNGKAQQEVTLPLWVNPLIEVIPLKWNYFSPKFCCYKYWCYQAWRRNEWISVFGRDGTQQTCIHVKLPWQKDRDAVQRWRKTEPPVSKHVLKPNRQHNNKELLSFYIMLNPHSVFHWVSKIIWSLGALNRE